MAIDTNDLKKEVVDFFHKVGIDLDAAVTYEDETYRIELLTEESGLIIGYHGDTLNDFQTVLALLLNNKYSRDSWSRFVIDIGGWKKAREKELEDFVTKAISKVRATGEAYSFPPMKPGERRFVHMVVSEQAPDLVTESDGTGANRKVVISPATGTPTPEK